MHDMRVSKADFHVHSKYSDRPSEWFLRRIGTPECFVEPRRSLSQRSAARDGLRHHLRPQLHPRRAGDRPPARHVHLQRGHHLLPRKRLQGPPARAGINEEQFRMIQELRADIYHLQEYLMDEDIICSVAHPLFRVNGRLTIDQLEKLILLFPRFEVINGARDRRSADLAGAVFRNLTPELMANMADRQGLEPCGPEPWKKTFTGGSDDHSGAYIGRGLHGHAAGRGRRRVPGPPSPRRPRAGRLLRRQRGDGPRLLPHRLQLLQGPLPPRRHRRQADAGRRAVQEAAGRLGRADSRPASGTASAAWRPRLVWSRQIEQAQRNGTTDRR